MLNEKIRKPFIVDKKAKYEISYHRFSYRKVKWANINLLRRNINLRLELAQVNKKLKLYECHDGLNTVLQVVEETNQLLSSALLDDNNSKGKHVHEKGETQQKDSATMVATSEDNLALKQKMMEWKIKKEELRVKLYKLMRQWEEMEPLQKLETMKNRHAQLESTKLQQDIDILKLDRHYL